MTQNETVLKTEPRKITHNVRGMKFGLNEFYIFKNDKGEEIEVAPGMTLQTINGKIRLDPGQAVALLNLLTNDKAARSLLRELSEAQLQHESQQAKIAW